MSYILAQGVKNIKNFFIVLRTLANSDCLCPFLKHCSFLFCSPASCRYLPCARVALFILAHIEALFAQCLNVILYGDSRVHRALLRMAMHVKFHLLPFPFLFIILSFFSFPGLIIQITLPGYVSSSPLIQAICSAQEMRSYKRTPEFPGNPFQALPFFRQHTGSFRFHARNRRRIRCIFVHPAP